MNIELLQTAFIADIKQKIRQAQYDALKIVNVHLINLYWEIGKAISEKQAESWGKAIVPTLAKELQNEFPGIGGFSTTNLWLMAQFYSEYQADENLQPLVGEISWTKHIVILNKCNDSLERKFYTLATKKFGWSKNVLIHQIENKTYEKYLLNQTNFEQTLPDNIQNQAVLAVKDEYTFDFLGLSQLHSEKELEESLIQNIRNFLLEMGYQFTFIGNQFRLEAGGKEYFIDLLLYHRQLQCLVAIELKVGEFLPEYKGKMEFYLSLLNDKVRLPHENDSIGIIICKEKNRTIVEYSLKTSKLPIGVATYTLTDTLPKSYQNLLPSSKEISDKINKYFSKK
ncbi:MAG: PDDEXK nuclease domain-containing protein [Bacteroidales bacterium]|jgi:predicted nuclease of restriction endonuclease-like (RecB) superfamily|nr:PDDEXK nuclease domain-containing protein [Acholeplasmataceae bacterium]MCK9290384.1 PDDEXK nuclease domain-containing protein [Bacteroidales bacterium]MDD3700730.1 PDDEXK nuclease domain-containing protein [Bacteroidales bacterium]MDY0369378.1 PDDEXK nuclease domain-containing protein [Bacteroidales bacterium]